MKKKIKFFLHHHLTQQIEITFIPEPKSFWQWALNILLFPFVGIKYFLLSVIKIFTTVVKLLSEFRLPQLNIQTLKKITSFTVLILLIILPIYALQISGEGRRVGYRVLGISDEAFNDILSAEQAIGRDDFTIAHNNFSDALTKLQTASNELNNSSIALRSISALLPKSVNAENILIAAQNLAFVGAQSVKLLAQINTLRLTPEGLTVGSGNLNSGQTLESIAQLTTQINDKLQEVNKLLAPINTALLPAEYQVIILSAKEQVQTLTNYSGQLETLAKILSDLLLNEKRFLVVLQNNNELRATGGFIGTIGQGQMKNGTISQLDIRSVYDLDGQLLEWILPPEPIFAVNNRLFLRDSNWLVNFPDTAKRLGVMYEKTGGATPDLIIGITPDLFIDLLSITGPITLPAYQVQITASNFIETIQSSTSINYDKTNNQPKQLLADLYPILLQKIGDINSGDWLPLLNILQSNLERKNIVIFSRDDQIQSTLQSLRWAGQVGKTDRDYIQINSSNLNGSKTDRLLQREAVLHTTINPDGSIVNRLQYTVQNDLPNNKLLSSKSWVRFLVPKGSTLLGASGFNEAPVVLIEDAHAYSIDPILGNWQNQLIHNPFYNISTGSEGDKTIFANWLEVQGGESKTVTITYQLPNHLTKVDRYSLLLEKQIGMMPFDFKQTIDFNTRKIKWENVNQKNRVVDHLTQNSIMWKKLIEFDNYIGLVLTK